MESTDRLLIEEHTDSSSFSSLSAEWDQLLSDASFRSPFLTRQWQCAWWDNFSAGKSLKLIAVRDRARRLVGVAPLYVDGKGDSIELIGDQDLCDHQDVLLARGEEKNVLKAILSHLWDSHRLPLHLHSLPASSPTLPILRGFAEEGECDLRMTGEDAAPTISLPSSFEEYLARLSPRYRHELRRKLRRIEAQGRTDLAKDESGSKLDVFLELHGRSSSEKRSFMNPNREKFFRAIVGSFSRQGWLSLFFLQFEGESIASLLCFKHERSLYVYNSGYNPAYSSLSPGIVLLTYSLRYAISEGVKEFNLLRGDESYKYHLGARDLNLFTIWARPKE